MNDPRMNGMDTEAATIDKFNPGGGACVEGINRMPRHAAVNREATAYGLDTMDMPVNGE